MRPVLLLFVLACSSLAGCDHDSVTARGTTTTLMTSTTYAQCRRDSDCIGFDCFCEFAVCHCLSTTSSSSTSTSTTTTTLPGMSSP